MNAGAVMYNNLFLQDKKQEGITRKTLARLLLRV
jgi:hypothetical protein